MVEDDHYIQGKLDLPATGENDDIRPREPLVNIPQRTDKGGEMSDEMSSHGMAESEDQDTSAGSVHPVESARRTEADGFFSLWISSGDIVFSNDPDSRGGKSGWICEGDALLALFRRSDMREMYVRGMVKDMRGNVRDERLSVGEWDVRKGSWIYVTRSWLRSAIGRKKRQPRARS